MHNTQSKLKAIVDFAKVDWARLQLTCGKSGYIVIGSPEQIVVDQDQQTAVRKFFGQWGTKICAVTFNLSCLDPTDWF